MNLDHTHDPLARSWLASANAPDTDFHVTLCDVYPDGRSMLVTDGVLRARYHKSFETESFLEPGQVYELNVDLWSTSLVFNKGHRIRVAVSSSKISRADVFCTPTLAFVTLVAWNVMSSVDSHSESLVRGTGTILLVSLGAKVTVSGNAVPS